MGDWQTVRYDPAYEEPLDEEIIPLCDALNAAGFVTTASCCGHGSAWPQVWFEHSTDERIESMARFVLAREQGDYRPFSSIFRKEVCREGYAWSLQIHLNRVFADTPKETALNEAKQAMDRVAQSIAAWHKSGVGQRAA